MSAIRQINCIPARQGQNASNSDAYCTVNAAAAAAAIGVVMMMTAMRIDESSKDR